MSSETGERQRFTVLQNGILYETGSALNLQHYGGISLCRPTEGQVIRIRELAERHLRAKYEVGFYNKAAEISAIYNHLVVGYEAEFSSAITRVADRGFIEFMFHEYDRTSEIDSLARQRKLPPKEAEWWDREGPFIRRAIKFIIERCVLTDTTPKSGLKRHEYRDSFDTIMVCAEMLVKCSAESDHTYYLFPQKFILEIHKPGSEKFLSLHLADQSIRGIVDGKHHKARARKDRQHRADFIKGEPFDNDTVQHDQILGEAFKETVGVSYKMALEMIVTLHNIALPAKEGFPIRFVPKSQVLENLSIMFEVGPSVVEKVLSAFMLTTETMASEPRSFWNPKNEYRAYRRAIFEMHHATGPHLAWSEAMLVEALQLLRWGIAYGNLPSEWKQTPLTESIGTLVTHGGKWFEQQVARQLRKLGFHPVTSRKGIGIGNSRLDFECGELDILAYNKTSKTLIIAECKTGLGGSEPKHFRDAMSNYIRKRDSHQVKFTRKISWTQAHMQQLITALNSSKEIGSNIEPQQVCYPMITQYPSFASSFIENFPCVSLSEFVMEYRKNRKWPYSTGRYELLPKS